MRNAYWHPLNRISSANRVTKRSTTSVKTTMARHIASRSDGSPFSKQKWKRNPRFSSTFHLPAFIPSTCRAVAQFFLFSSSSLSFGFGAISPDSRGASPAYSTNSPVSPAPPAARNVPFSPSCTDTPSRPGTTTTFCPSQSSSSSHSHFFPAARTHFIVRSPHRPHWSSMVASCWSGSLSATCTEFEGKAKTPQLKSPLKPKGLEFEAANHWHNQ